MGSFILKLYMLILPVMFCIITRFSVKWLLEFEDLPSEQRLNIRQLTSHLGTSLLTVKLSRRQIEQYQNNGFLIYRNAIDSNVLETMKISAMHVMEHPSGILQRANGTKYCGFAINPHILLDFWRHFMYKLPLSGFAADLMSTSQIVYSQDIIHATSYECGDNSVGKAHSDQNQSPYSIEKKVIEIYMVYASIPLYNIYT